MTAARLLLDLISSRPAEALPTPDEARAIGRLASAHRLGGLLHALHGRDDRIDAALRARWAGEAREHLVESLRWRADLERLLADLEAAGLPEPIVLKGPDLAMHAYPGPEQRPLRDLDLWLEPDAALAAFAALEARGYARADGAHGDPAAWSARGHELPPLRCPSGSWVELHVRLFHRHDDAPDLASDPAFRAGARARPLGSARYLAPGAEAMLVHLVEHGRAHRLDNGPLLLADLAYLVASEPALNWGEVERLLAAYRLEGSAALLLGEAARAFPEAPFPPRWRNAPCPIDRDALAALWLRDPDAREALHRHQLGRDWRASLARAFFPSHTFLAALYGRPRGPLGWIAAWGRNLARLVATRLPALAASRGHGLAALDRAEQALLALDRGRAG